MEVGVLERLSMRIAAGRAATHLVEQALHPGQHLAVEPADRVSRRDRLELATHVHRLDQLVGGRLANPSAKIRLHLDEPECHEVAQGLADRGLARAEQAGDAGLDDARPGHLALEDPLEHSTLHLGAEHAARQRTDRRVSLVHGQSMVM